MQTSPAEGLFLDYQDQVIEAVINYGDKNLISMAICRALADLLLDPPAGARVLHLRSGSRVFCLGRERVADSEQALREEAETLVLLNRALREGQLVTVAEVAGDAAGYGVGLAALSDLSFAAPSAHLWFPEVEAGLAPTVVLSWLPSLVSRSQSFRLTAGGARLDGREAARLGLVTGVADTDEDLPRLVREEIASLLRQPEQPQREIRAFLRDAALADTSAVDRMAVDQLVSNSLRLRRARAGNLAD